jgi:phospholipid/cholesterol/gamma-HCH transport system substrate-binding protein
MDENRLRFGVGVLVVAALGIAVILTFFFGAYPNLFAQRYDVTVRFPAAPGVSKETPVLKNGVQIGRVREITLVNPDQADGFDGVQIELEIDAKYPIQGNYIPTVTSGSLITGASRIEFLKANDRRLLELYDGAIDGNRNGMLEPEERALVMRPLTDGSAIGYGEVAKDPYEVLEMIGSLEGDVRATLVSIQSAGQSVQSAGQSVDRLAGQVGSLVGDEGELRDLSLRISGVVDEIDLTVREVRGLVGDPEMRAALRQSIERLPGIMKNADETIAKFRAEVDGIDGIGQSARRAVEAVERTASNVDKITSPFADNSEQLVASIQKTLDDLDQTILQVSLFGEMLNQGDGTLRRLIEDDELYWQVKRVVDNIEVATVKIRPILDDARILSDKLARDPRQLGIKGALDKRPSGTGLK